VRSGWSVGIKDRTKRRRAQQPPAPAARQSLRAAMGGEDRRWIKAHERKVAKRARYSTRHQLVLRRPISGIFNALLGNRPLHDRRQVRKGGLIHHWDRPAHGLRCKPTQSSGTGNIYPFATLSAKLKPASRHQSAAVAVSITTPSLKQTMASTKLRCSVHCLAGNCQTICRTEAGTVAQPAGYGNGHPRLGYGYKNRAPANRSIGSTTGVRLDPSRKSCQLKRRRRFKHSASCRIWSRANKGRSVS
jgi:hypothetical protein